MSLRSKYHRYIPLGDQCFFDKKEAASCHCDCCTGGERMACQVPLVVSWILHLFWIPNCLKVGGRRGMRAHCDGARDYGFRNCPEALSSAVHDLNCSLISSGNSRQSTSWIAP